MNFKPSTVDRKLFRSLFLFGGTKMICSFSDAVLEKILGEVSGLELPSKKYALQML